MMRPLFLSGAYKRDTGQETESSTEGRQMTITNITDAMQAVHDLAKQANIANLGPFSGTVEDQENWKENSITSFGDMVGNLYEDIEDYLEEKGGITALYNEQGCVPEMSAYEVADMLVELGYEHMKLTLELAELRLSDIDAPEYIQTMDEDANPIQVKSDEALKLVLSLVSKYGEDLFGTQISNIQLPDNFFARADAD
jgi:hypothetical protein